MKFVFLLMFFVTMLYLTVSHQSHVFVFFKYAIIKKQLYMGRIYLKNHNSDKIGFYIKTYPDN